MYKPSLAGVESKHDLSDISVEINLQEPNNKIFENDYFDSSPKMEPAFEMEMKPLPQYSRTATRPSKRVMKKTSS